MQAVAIHVGKARPILSDWKVGHAKAIAGQGTRLVVQMLLLRLWLVLQLRRLQLVGQLLRLLAYGRRVA